MSDCFKESDRSKDVSEQHCFGGIARDQWREKSPAWTLSDTASAHLPPLSISGQEGGAEVGSCSQRERLSGAHSSGDRSSGEQSFEDHHGHRHHHHHEHHPNHHRNSSSEQSSSGASSSDSSSGSDAGSSGTQGGLDAPPSSIQTGSDTSFGGTQTNMPSDTQSVIDTIPDGAQSTDSNFGGISNPTDAWTAVVPKTNISDLTQLSEQLLPVHSNGSYPSTTDWEDLHSANVQRAANAAQNGSNLEFFGDSITEAMGWNPAAMQPFNDAFGADKPTALGLGGDGTAQLLYRLNHGEMQGQPKAAVLMIGTNDLGSLSAAQIAENTEKSIESIQLRSPNTKVVVMGILPRPDDGDPGNAMVDAANSALSRLATADGAVQFTNLRNSFVDANGNELPELYQTDKLHLSPAGYQVWADGLRDALARNVSAPSASSGDNALNSSDQSSSRSDGAYVQSDQSSYDSHSTYIPLRQSDAALTLDTAGIRGVNLSGAEWGKNSSQDSQFWPTAQELDYYKSKGMNTVRLAISWEQFQPQLNGPLDPSEMARLDNFLHESDARGMKVLLNLANFDRYSLNHGPNGQGVDGETEGTVVGQPGVPVSAMQDFWSRMVQHVDADASTSRAIAGWDLTNEPFGTNGSWPATATAVDQAIRATGDNHTVVVEGDQWARDFSGLEGLAKSDKNVAFEAHSYWDDGSGGYANPNPTGDPNVGVDNIRPFVQWLQQNDAKGFVGEWGVPTNNTAWAPAVTNFIHYLNQNGMGNMVWAGGPGWQKDYTLSVEPINGQDRAIMSTIVQANNFD